MSKKGSHKMHSLQTCFECEDNKTTCDICKETCIGCLVCKTKPKEPCIHCKISCSYEISCFIRGEWEDISNKKNICNKTETVVHDIVECRECEYGYFCVYNHNICPEDMSAAEMMEFGLNDFKSICQTEMNCKTDNSVNSTLPIKSFNSGDDVWDTKIECISDCPHKTEIKIKISMQVVLKLTYLQQQFPHHEFTVYANIITQDNEYLLDDIVIPKQKVSYAAVNEIIIDGNYNTIIHKHPGDKPGGFSGVDEEFANSNHDYSILIGSKGIDKIIGTSRIKTDCGKFMRLPLKFEVMLPSVTDEKFLSEVNNIEKTVYSSTNIYKTDRVIQEWQNKRKYFY